MWAWLCRGGVPYGIRSQPLQGTGVELRSEGKPVPNNSNPLLCARYAGKKYLWFSKTSKRGIKSVRLFREMKDWKTSSSSWKRKVKEMERLGLALEVIQDRMRKNIPTTVETDVGEADEVLDSLFNTHKCLLNSGVESQKKLESHPATKKMGIFRGPRSASLGDTQKSKRRVKEGQPPRPSRKNSQEGEGHLRMPRWPRAPNKEGDWQVVTKRGNAIRVSDFLESDAGFVWVAGVRLYNCYFSPNDPSKVFETQILILDECLSEAVGRTLIGGDFNSESPEWGEARLDRRGILVG